MKAHVNTQHYPPDVVWNMPMPTGPLYQLLDDAASRHPTRTAITFLGRHISYMTVHAAANRLAAQLRERGLKAGDRIGLCLPNCPLSVIAYFAVLKMGGVVVNMNPLYTAPEMAAQVADSDAMAVITVNLHVTLDKLVPLVRQKALKHLFVADFATMMPWGTGLLFRLFKRSNIAAIPDIAGVDNLDALPTPAPSFKPAAMKAGHLALLQYTGGTTGTPKAAMLTHGALSANTRQVQVWLGDIPPEGDTFLVILPLFHCFAMTAGMNLAIANAARMVLIPQLNLKDLLKTIRHEKPTIVPGVPTLFNAIANAAGVTSEHFGSIRYCISGGAPLPTEVKERFEKLTGARIMEGYGLTEASPVAACNPRHITSKEGSVGLPLPQTEIAIFNPDKPTKPLPVGETGEIWVKGPQLMDGYWNKPADTNAVLIKGWLRTGDVGHIAPDGYVYITDRLKDMIISNGYKVYPRVVEDALYRHPSVMEAVVIGIPHAKRGEAPKAFVKLKDGADVTADALIAFISKHLNPLERPVEVEFRQQLPKTLVGKLSKKELVAEEKAKRNLA